MKIGLISEAYPPMSGGVATSAQRVARNLVKAGNDVTVLTFENTHDVTEQDLFIREEDMGVTVYRIGPFFLKNPRIPDGGISEKYKAVLRRRAFNQMIRILKNDMPDILLSFYIINAGFIAQLVANELKLPVVAGVRGNDIGRNIFDITRFAPVYWVMDSADAIVCVNKHLRNRLLIAYPDMEKKSLVIKNSYDLAKLKKTTDRTVARAELVKKFNWNKEDLILNFTGSLREKKGVVTLCHALDMINDSEDKVRLLVIGPDLGNVEKKLIGDIWNKLKEKNIIQVTGQCDRDEVPFLIAATDAGCFPSSDDGMANGVLENMALGLPVIGTEIFEDVLTNLQDGLLIPVDDTQALVEAIRTLYDDRNLICSMGKKAVNTIAYEFTPEIETGAYIRLFNQILERR